MRHRLLTPALSLSGLLLCSLAVAQSSPPPAGTGTNMQAGGLTPPPPMTYQTPPGETVRTPTEDQLDKAKREDSGRGLEWVYVNVEGGYQVLGLETLQSDGLTYARSAHSKDTGPVVGAGAGVRLLFLTLGARARLASFPQWNLATYNAEVGLHLPLGALEPYVTFSGGYANLTSFDKARWGIENVTIHGFDARLGFGLDYYVTPVFSLGANLTGEMLVLKRKAVTLSSSALDAESQRLAASSGSSLGAAGTLTAVAGLHF